MREFAAGFYKSTAWTDCRKGYIAYKSGLCENCLRQGIITPGVIVHHKIHITPDNIENPEITLNYNNLELLCRDCHGKQHNKKRYKIDMATGKVKT